MRKRITISDFTQKRLLSEQEACCYIGTGRTLTRRQCETWGCVKYIGRRRLYDKAIIDAHLDNMG